MRSSLKNKMREGGHIENGPGRLILEKGGHVSNPGVINDWMNLINTGARPTATGNSDSHSLEEELGSPRNYIRLEKGLTPSAGIANRRCDGPRYRRGD